MTQPFPPFEPYQPHQTPNSPSQDQPTYVDLATPGEYSPPPTPRPGSVWRTVWVVGVALAACVLAATIGAYAANVSGALPRAANVGGARQPTATPASTATTTGAMPGATLGGTLAAFEAGFHAPTTAAQGAYIWNALTFDGRQMALKLTLATGLDGAPHVATIALVPGGVAGSVWDTQTAFALAQQFAPNDATLVRDQTGGSSYLDRYESSASLGAIFRSGGDRGDDGGADGLFVMSCHLAPTSGQRVDGCTLTMAQRRGDG